MLQKLLLLVLIGLPISLCGQENKKDVFRLFYLGGQSNMDGYGRNAELPDSLDNELQNVWIFHGNPTPDGKEGGAGEWDRLKPGHGVGFVYNKRNKLSDFFGMELSFAHKLQELYPNDKIAFIKYSRGGSSIDSMAAESFGCWEPDFKGENGINQYDNFLSTMREALGVKDINNDGREDLLVPSGIIWMQGESDANHTEDIANRYYYNLKRLMDLIRASMLVDDVPVVIGKISDSGRDKNGKVWEYGELIQFAQEKFVKTDGNAAIVRDTKFYDHSDPWHYDSKGYIDMGIKFAEAYSKIRKD